MRELTDEYSLWHIGALYPNVRKVTVDLDNRTAYVFTGRSNRAMVITGAEFDALQQVIEKRQLFGDEPPADAPSIGESPVEVEAVEAVISVVAEQEVPAEPPAKARPGRGSKKES